MRAARAVLALFLLTPSLLDASDVQQTDAPIVIETVVYTIYIPDGHKIDETAVTAGLDNQWSAKPLITGEEHTHCGETRKNQFTSTLNEEMTRTSGREHSPATAPLLKNTGYMSVVTHWRGKMGLKALMDDAMLGNNALDTVVSSNGKMVHKLNSGTFGQVLAPGNAEDFEHVFVGGWLCEIPTLPGLDGICSTASDGWAYNGQTGHARILISDDYSKIGCAMHAGIWCCDLA